MTGQLKYNQDAMSIFGDKMEQKAGDGAFLVQGQTVNVGMTYSDVKDLCTTLVQKELAIYEQKASATAIQRFDHIIDKLLVALSKLDEQYKMKFQEPAIQFAARETFKEYIRSGKEELSDDLIDLMIERLTVDEHTTKQALIDEARQILPKLSTSSVAILALLAACKLLFIRRRDGFVEVFKRLTPLAKEVGTPHSMDIAYLEQIRCGQSLSFVNSFSPFVDTMMKTYAPIFTHPITIDEFNNIMAEEGLNTGDHKILGTILSLFKTEGNNMSLDISVVTEKMFVEKNEELIPSLNKVVSRLPRYNADEARQFFLEIDKNWNNVIDLFNRKDIQSFMVSPVGNYIGTRKLSKLMGEYVSIDLFYHN